jgi:predicted methyltransferase
MRRASIALVLTAACASSPPAVQSCPPPSVAAANGTASAAPTASAAVSPAAPKSIDDELRAAVARDDRRKKDPPRDKYLHPVETLEAFGLRDDMTVVELSPSGGYWTTILAPVLADRGHLRVANGDPISEGATPRPYLKGRFEQAPSLFGKVETVVTDWTKDGQSLGPDGSADMVLTFRNLHDWLGEGVAERVLSAAYRVLKPNGILGLTDHRGRDDGPTDAKSFADDGGAYVPEPFMIHFVEKAGFTFVAKSEVNANPRDTKDYPKGALTLPPWYALGDVDRAKYEAIGEGDCMTLKFVRK